MSAYYRPTRLDDALALRASHPLTVLAGGTDIFPLRAARAGWGTPWRQDMLDLSALDEMRGITVGADAVRLGALTTWTEIADAADTLPAAFAGLCAAARAVGGRQVQNRGTLAGNLCTASPAGDGIPNLMALDARVELTSLADTRLVPVTQFVSGYRQTILRPDELITALHVPVPVAGARGGFLKLGARSYLVISIAMVAGVVACEPNGIIGHAALAVGACAATARRLPDLEAALTGQPSDRAGVIIAGAPLAELDPIDDIRSSAAHRRRAARQLLSDLVADLTGGRRAA